MVCQLPEEAVCKLPDATSNNARFGPEPGPPIAKPFGEMYTDGPIEPQRSACNGAGGASQSPLQFRGSAGREGAGGAPIAPSPVDIDVVDDHDSVGQTSRQIRELPIYPFSGERVIGGSRDVPDLLCRVERATEGQPIGQLTLDGHGRPGFQRVAPGAGNGIDVEQIGQNRDAIRALEFSKNGNIVLDGCNVADGPDGYALLRLLAQTSNVPVSAGVDLQDAQPGFEGPYVTCYPATTPGANPVCESSTGHDYSVDPYSGRAGAVPNGSQRIPIAK
jgi:hypothetical protein